MFRDQTESMKFWVVCIAKFTVEYLFEKSFFRKVTFYTRFLYQSPAQKKKISSVRQMLNFVGKSFMKIEKVSALYHITLHVSLIILNN